MSSMKTLLEELTALRLMSDLQHIEMQRQRRQMELSVRRTADLQGQLDRLQRLFERAERALQDVKAPARSSASKRVRAN